MYEVAKSRILAFLQGFELNNVLSYSVWHKSWVAIDGVQVVPGGVVVASYSLNELEWLISQARTQERDWISL